MRFRKKPVEVEARRLGVGDPRAKVEALAEWCGGEVGGILSISGPTQYEVFIKTLEGTMTASEGDWIIKGVQGEFYPCRPDIFEETYEPVEEHESV